MKTYEELVEKFRQEFEKKRKKKIQNLWFQLPFIIGVLATMIFAEIMLYQSVLELLSTKEDWPLIIILPFIGLIVLALIGLMIYSLPSSFIEDYRISYLKKYPSEQLQRSINRIPIIKRRITMIQNKIKKQKFLLEQINSPHFTIITSNPLYSDNVSLSIKKNEDLLKEHLENLNNCNDTISQLTAKLEVYAQIPEKNLWQYLKSFKWHKKIN